MHLLLLAVCIAGRLENKRKIRRRVLTVSIQRYMKFHLVVVKWRQRNVQKVCCTCLLSYEYDSRFFIQEINSLTRQVGQFFALTTTAPFGRNWIEKWLSRPNWLRESVPVCIICLNDRILYFSLHGPRSDNTGQGSRVRKSSRYLEYWMCCGWDGNRKGTQNF